MRRFSIVYLWFTLNTGDSMKPLLTLAALAFALVMPARAAEEAHAPAGKETYASGLGEIMSLQQMRHLKLWLAGAAKNWPLADYELDELDRSARRRKVRRRLRQAHRRLQHLPPGHQSSFHRDPAADVLALYQPIVRPEEIVDLVIATPRSGGSNPEEHVRSPGLLRRPAGSSQ